MAGVFHHASPHGVELDVAATDEKVGFGLHRAGFVAPFPQGAAALVVAIDVLDIPPADRLHELGGAFRCLRCKQEVDMIGHQDVGMDGATPVGSRFSEPVEVAVVVLFGKEAWLPVDASLDEVLRDSS